MPGIGPALSSRIIAAREKAPFKKIEDLRRVSGIGSKTIEKLRPLVIVDGQAHDGRLGESAAVGVSPAQVAGYLVAQGAYTALLFDGGGSTEMIARRPGASTTAVMNTPSDGHERPVANGLFIYTNEKAAGPATSVVIKSPEINRPVSSRK